MARHGDSKRKRREAYQQHHGKITGAIKNIAAALKPGGGD